MCRNVYCTLKEAELIPDSAVPKPLDSRCKSDKGLDLKVVKSIRLTELGKGPATESKDSVQTSSRKTLQFAGE